ncbi:MAG: N-acetyltransferase family protein [Bacillota bacterium]
MVVRPATREDVLGLAKVHVDTWKAAYRGIVADSFLDGLSYERSAKGWERSLDEAESRQRVFVAVDDNGSVIGFASGGPNRDTDTPHKAELWAIYVLPEGQGRGTGTLLLRRFAEAVAAEGLDSLSVWVLADNARGRGFYEAMGGVLAGRRQVMIGGQSLEEVAYGWENLQTLIG